MKVAVYTIALNEERHVDRWAESCAQADVRLILDTGSTDRTVELARAAGVTVHERTFSPFRFDEARNAALDLIPEDVDLCVTLDMDEVLMPGWRDALEALPDGVTKPRFKYVFSRNPDGSEGLTFATHSSHHRHGYRWAGAIHEAVVRNPAAGPEVQGFCDAVVENLPDLDKPRTQYLDMLADATRNEPGEPRYAFYYGRELMYRGRTGEAIAELKRYLALNGAHSAERATALRYLAVMDKARSEKYLLWACAEAPERREPWVDLALLHYRRESWEECLAASSRALSITERPLGYFCEPQAWGADPHDLAALSCHYLGMRERAIEHGERAVALDRSDPRLQTNLTFYRDEVVA